MDEISSLVIPKSNNLSNRDWFLGAIEDDSVLIPLDASDGGFFTGNFVPPPPRPSFLDESVTTDGLTTCDLCSWAWQNANTHSIDSNLEASGELGWVLTLVIVSLSSALVGAIVMIIALHCKRLKSTSSNDSQRQSAPPNVQVRPNDLPGNTSDKPITPSNFSNKQNGVWSWLSRRPAIATSQLENSQSSFAQNHYTHMEDAYNVDDALYAELEVESTVDRDSNSPAYQNSAYTDPDGPTSSAPSSAYYSDLSITTVPDRAYEVVGLVTLPVWDPNLNNEIRRHAPARLAAISENVTVPSDYV